MVHLWNTFLESGKLLSDVSAVYEDTDGCAKKYRCDLNIYLTTVLSSLYGIIINRAMNAPGCRNNVV